MRPLSLATSFVLWFAAAAAAQATYSVVDLGRFPGGGYDTSALAVNDAGHVVGDRHGYRWTLCRLSLYELVGEADDTSSLAHAFIYSAAAGMQDLESLIPPDSGWILSSAIGISDAGYIVGNGIHNGRSSTFLLIPTSTQVTVDTSPAGLTALVDGVSATDPKTYHWTRSSQHQIATTDPQDVLTGCRLAFASWSDGGAFAHAVTTPSSPTTYRSQARNRSSTRFEQITHLAHVRRGEEGGLRKNDQILGGEAEGQGARQVVFPFENSSLH